MLALFTTFILLQHASLISAATPFIPAVKTEKEGQAMIRGLIELSNRQSYYCPAPSYTCVYPNSCCLNSLHQCCRDGSCCRPNYYCGLASNGIIGCCPDGLICSGPVNGPSTSTIYNTITSTSTSTFNIPVPTTTYRVPTPNTSTFDTSTFGSNPSPTLDTTTLNTTTTTRGTTTSTPSIARISTSDPRSDPTSGIQNISNSAIGSTGNAILTFLCMVSNMMVLYVWSF